MPNATVMTTKEFVDAYFSDAPDRPLRPGVQAPIVAIQPGAAAEYDRSTGKTTYPTWYLEVRHVEEFPASPRTPYCAELPARYYFYVASPGSPEKPHDDMTAFVFNKTHDRLSGSGRGPNGENNYVEVIVNE